MPRAPISIPSRAAHKSYTSPPIEEAICDVQFASESEWNSTVPGLVYAELREEYPSKPEDQELHEARIDINAGIEPPQLRTVKSGRLILRSADGARLVLIGENRLGVNDLRPYSGWREYRPRIERALNAYCKIAEPAGVTRIGVRYINVVRLPADQVRLGDYFNNAPAVHPALGDTIQSFILRTESTLSDGVTVHATLTDQKGDGAGVAFLLDLDVFKEWSRDDPLPMEGAGAYIADLRDKEYEAFEALITDGAREIFNHPTEAS